MEKLNENFTDFLKLLNEHNVTYLLIGGYAVGYHGYVRATGDLDIYYDRTKQNSEALVLVFKKFGFDLPNLTNELFLEENKIVRIGVPPLRLEVMNSISGVKFKEIYEKRIDVDIAGLIIPVIDLESLLINKKASGRSKDITDIEELTKNRK